MPDPTPIRGRWYSERDVGRLLFSLQIEPEDIDAALEQFERSEVVPDEQAIERAADVLERWYGDSPDRLHIARAVLAAALEQPE